MSRFVAMYLLLPEIRRLGAILALGLAFGAAAGAGPALAEDEPCSSIFREGCESLPTCPWYVSTDAIAMQRLFSGLGPAATLGASSSGTVALSQQSLDDPFRAGVRMLVGHSFGNSPYQIEASYFWLSASDTSAQAADAAGNLFSPFTNFGAPPDPRVDNNTLVDIHLVSQLENGEVNLKCKLPMPDGDPTIALLFGVRHIAIREQFDYSSAPLASSPVSVHARTNNSLWGPQIGGLVDYGRQDVWLRFEGKAAICNNDADRDLEASVSGATAAHPRIMRSGTATVGDISASVLWNPTPALTAKIGYQALWVDQVALASRNYASDVSSLINPAAEPPINQRGTLIYHGPFAGLQLSW